VPHLLNVNPVRQILVFRTLRYSTVASTFHIMQMTCIVMVFPTYVFND